MMWTKRNYSSMLDKGLAIIEVLAAAKKPLKIAELAEKLSIPRPTIYRLIDTLEARGYVRSMGQTTEYFLSLKFLQLGEVVRDSLELRKLAYPYMERLRDEVELAVHLVVRDNDEAVYVEKVESRRPVRLFTQVGRRVPLHVTACPRVLLAFNSDHEIEKYIAAAKMVKFTPNTVADPETLWSRIHEIRSKGYSTAYGELEPETAAVAVPIRNNREEVVAALSVAGPEWHFKSVKLDDLVARVQKYASGISQELGYMEKAK